MVKTFKVTKSHDLSWKRDMSQKIHDWDMVNIDPEYEKSYTLYRLEPLLVTLSERSESLVRF